MLTFFVYIIVVVGLELVGAYSPSLKKEIHEKSSIVAS